jgi:hypothetical protein
MKDLSNMDFDALTVQEFEELLPELFETSGGNISNDPRFSKFLAANPVCADLVKDLETIASTAKSLFEPTHEPNDAVWQNIASKLKDEPLAD